MATKNAPQDQSNERKISWVPVPIERIREALESKELPPEHHQAILTGLKTLRGPMRIQEDNKGHLWVAFNGGSVIAFEEVYKKLGLINEKVDLLELMTHYSLLHIAVRKQLGPVTLERSSLEGSPKMVELVEQTARYYGLERAPFGRQWLEAFLIHTIDFLDGLEELGLRSEPEQVTPFLIYSTRVFKSVAKRGGDILAAIGQLLSSNGHQRARRAVLKRLAAVGESMGGEKKSRIRRVQLKKPRRIEALEKLQQSLGALAGAGAMRQRADSGRKLRRHPLSASRRNRRQAQRRSRMRSQRLVKWAAKDEGKNDVKRDVVKRDGGKNKVAAKARAAEARAKPAEARAEPKARSKSKKARRKDPAQVKRQQRRKKSQARQKSQRLTQWSVSLANADVVGDMVGEAVNADAAAARTKPESKTKPEGRSRSKGSRKKGKRKTRKLSKPGGKKRRRRATGSLQSRRLATWASQEMPAVGDMVGGAIAGQLVEAKPLDEAPKKAEKKAEKKEDKGAKASAVRKKGSSTAGKASAVRRRSRRSGMPNPVVIGGVAIGILFLLFLLSKLDFNAGERDSLRARIADLGPRSSFRDYQRGEEAIRDFQAQFTEGSDQQVAVDLLGQLESKRENVVSSLVSRARDITDADIDSIDQQSKAEALANLLKAWSELDPSLVKRERRIRERLTDCREYLKLARDLVEKVQLEARPSSLELHELVADQRPEESGKDLLSEYTKALAEVDRGKSMSDIFAIMSDARFHPVIEPDLYREVERKLGYILKKGLSAKREQLCLETRTRVRNLASVATDYNRLMRSAYDRVLAADLNTARSTLQASRFKSDYWFKLSIDWLGSDLAREYIAKPERAERKPRPDVVARRPQPREAFPEEPRGPKPEAKTEDEDKRSYKEAFADLLDQYSSSRSDRGIVVAEMKKVMQDASGLMRASPAMAKDVVRFFNERKSKFAKEAELKGMLDAQVKAAFEVLLPTTTGPSGFWALRDWCKELRYKEGTDQLKPILARLRPADRRNNIYVRQAGLRKKREGVKESVEKFIGKRRVENVKALRKLVAYLRENNYRNADIEKDFRDMANKLVAKVGKDVRLSRQLVADLQRVPQGQHSARESESISKTYFTRSKKLMDEAEDDFIDGVVKALKAKEPAIGFDILQQALIINPNSDRAFKGLKYKKHDDRYVRPWEYALRVKGYDWDPKIGWFKGEKQEGKYYNRDSGRWEDLTAANRAHSEAGNPWIMKSEHFVLKSTAPLAETVTVSNRLEAFYLQLFRQFDLFFAPRGNAVVVFGLAEKPPLVVNYYKDRAQFKQSANPPTDWAAGFYSGGRHASFFYSTPGDWTVLQHEIVHQILGENSRGHAVNWIAEGTAVYMENAYFNNDFVLKLGPVERHRRPYRYLREAQGGRPTIGFDEILGLDTSQKWGAGNVGDHYKGAGSVIYFFMTFDNGRYRGDFLDYLLYNYSGGSPVSLTHYFGLSRETLKWLFDRFYKQGFTTLNGRVVSHEEKLAFDLEVIARNYPDPDPKARKAKKKRGAKTSGGKVAEASGEVKDLIRTLMSNPNQDKRYQAARALASLGDPGKTALEDGLTKLTQKARDNVSKYLKSSRNKARFRKKLAGIILRRRAEARAFIFDKSKYPDENHGAVGQPGVDKLVNALRAAWEDPYSVVMESEDGKFKDLLDKLDTYHQWRKELLGDSPDAEADKKAIQEEANEAIRIKDIPLSKADADIKKANEAILNYNAKCNTIMNEQERICCEATNNYRMMFGMKALKYDDRMVKAARLHSEEMQKLGYFAHDSPTPANRTPKMRCDRQGARYSGENIAKGQATGYLAFMGWYNSSGHHRNILGKVHRTIGLGQAGRHWTQDFGVDNPTLK